MPPLPLLSGPPDDAARRLVEILDCAEDAVVTLDLLGAIQSWNHGAEEMLGHSAQEMNGASLAPFLPDTARNELNALVRKVISAWPQAIYLDVFPLMLQADGIHPRPELYAEDGLHLSRTGYRLWAAEVRDCLHELGLYP